MRHDLFFRLPKTGGNHRHPDFLVHRLINHHAPDDIGIFMGLFLNERGGFVNLIQGHVLAAGDIDEKAPCPFNGDVFQQGAGDRLLGCFDRPALSRGNAGSHQRHPRLRHDGPDIGKVEVDDPVIPR